MKNISDLDEDIVKIYVEDKPRSDTNNSNSSSNESIHIDYDMIKLTDNQKELANKILNMQVDSECNMLNSLPNLCFVNTIGILKIMCGLFFLGFVVIVFVIFILRTQ